MGRFAFCGESEIRLQIRLDVSRWLAVERSDFHLAKSHDAGREQTTETAESKPMPAFVGANAVFIPAEARVKAHPGARHLDLDPCAGTRTFVGYLYGGIQAKPYRFRTISPLATPNSGVIPTTN